MDGRRLRGLSPFKQILSTGRSISSLSNTIFIEEGIITCSLGVKGRTYWDDACEGGDPFMIMEINF
jgi:hypothetical protein